MAGISRILPATYGLDGIRRVLIVGQGFTPGSVLRLEVRQRGDRVIPALDPTAPVGRVADANDRYTYCASRR